MAKMTKIDFSEASTLEELAGLAMSAASMCWESIEQAGVFNDNEAEAVVNALVKRICELTEAGIRSDLADEAGDEPEFPNNSEIITTARSEQEFLGNRNAGPIDGAAFVDGLVAGLAGERRPAESWFEQDLENALNWAGVDSRAGEPDFLLAQTLVKAPTLQRYIKPTEPEPQLAAVQERSEPELPDWVRDAQAVGRGEEPQLGDVTDLDTEKAIDGDGFGESIRRSVIEAGLTELVQQSGTNSRDHGFHQDRERIVDLSNLVPSEHFDELLRLWQISKLDLMHEELSEVLGELRDGHTFNEIYYLNKETGVRHFRQSYDEDGVPQFKPEGAIIELADLIIRAADLAFTEGSDLAKAISIKHEYNASRPYLHGRKL